MKRCFCPDSLETAAPGETRRLSTAEAHHLRDVLRVARDHLLEAFDGRGWSATVRVLTVSKRDVEIEIQSRPLRQMVRRPRLWVAAAAPKQDRLRWLVEKGVELGLDRFTPLITERSVVEPGAGKLAKLQETAVQACKQSGRNDLPILDAPVAWDRFLAEAVASPAAGRRLLLCDRAGEPLQSQLAREEMQPPEEVVVLIGPEGGLTETERNEAEQAGAIPVRLAADILRVETAVLAAIACVRSHWLEARSPE